jgi:hypothetical protein
MSNKQTAVEWLEDEVYKIINEYEPFACSYYLEKAFEQAKEMHKQEIIDAWKNAEGYNDLTNEKLAEQYYNETFGKL